MTIERVIQSSSTLRSGLEEPLLPLAGEVSSGDSRGETPGALISKALTRVLAAAKREKKEAAIVLRQLLEIPSHQDRLSAIREEPFDALVPLGYLLLAEVQLLEGPLFGKDREAAELVLEVGNRLLARRVWPVLTEDLRAWAWLVLVRSRGARSDLPLPSYRRYAGGKGPYPNPLPPITSSGKRKLAQASEWLSLAKQASRRGSGDVNLSAHLLLEGGWLNLEEGRFFEALKSLVASQDLFSALGVPQLAILCEALIRQAESQRKGRWASYGNDRLGSRLELVEGHGSQFIEELEQALRATGTVGTGPLLARSRRLFMELPQADSMLKGSQ